jgi:chromosome segregation ATPase
MAKKVYIDFELKYKEAVANLDEMQKEYTKLEKEVAKTKDTQEELGGVLDKTTGGAITKFKGLKGTLGGVIKSFKTLRGAIIATGIGALIVAVGSLTAMFSRSEEGQNKFAKILTQLGVIAGNVMDIFSDLGKVVFNVFTGNFKAAGEALNEVTEGIKNFGEETRKEIEIAGELADMRAKADIEERKLITERAEANRRVAELREKAADKENVSVQERIEAIKEAGRIEEEITKKEIEAARLRFEAKQLENSLAESTKEDLDEEARLKARLTELETGRLKIQKALTAEITTALREEEAERKAAEAERKAKEKELAEDFVFLAGVGFVSKEVFDQMKAKKDAAEKKRKADEAEAEKQTQLRNERIAANEVVTQQKIMDAKRMAVDTAISLFGAETAAGKAALIAKQILAAQEMIQEARKTITFSSLVAARSSAAVAEGTAQTAKIGFPQNIPMLIAYALQAVGIISAISSAVGKSKRVAGSIGAGGGITVDTTAAAGASSASSITAPSIVPQFNTVGASGTNQLASILGGQQEQPIRAFVVSGDVSTAQEMDRNIISSASLG